MRKAFLKISQLAKETIMKEALGSHISQMFENFVMQIVLLLSCYQQLNLGQDWLTRMFANQFEIRLGWAPTEVCQNFLSKDKVDSWSHFGNGFAHYLIICFILYCPDLKLQLFWRHSRDKVKINKDSTHNAETQT